MYDIYLYDRVVGRLVPRGEGVRFSYTREALADGSMPAISLSMPKQAAAHGGRVARAFFLNLLPEGGYKRLVAQAGASVPASDRALLGAIGGECPGAIAIWPEGEEPPATPGYEPLTPDEMLRLFDPANPVAIAHALRRARLSLAGMQDKIALYSDDGARWWLPVNGAITSHILKRSAAGFAALLENELFCMTLAADVGLAAAAVGLPAPAVRVFCTERFDRTRAAESAGESYLRRKLHQEDFCQILGVLPDRKYENEGGPGLRQCARVVHEHSALPVEDLVRLLHWVGFNYLIGNEDANGKNLALLYQPDGLRLAPFYDLVSTEVHTGLERGAAMKIGGQWSLGAVEARDWVRVAGLLSMTWAAARAELLQLADRVAATLATTTDGCREMFGAAPVYASVGALVQERCARLGRGLSRSAR